VSDNQVAVVDAVLSFSKSENDERFAPCVIRIAHAWLNRNKSVISMEVFEQNAKTAYGCPIVCNYDIGADFIGGHDKAIIRTDDGTRLINMTHPVGYVPEGARYWWLAASTLLMALAASICWTKMVPSSWTAVATRYGKSMIRVPDTKIMLCSQL